MDSDRELRWTVALEAALFFSIPCWSLAVNPAWPSDDPSQFAFAVLAGASSALVLCHITPAMCESTMRSFFSSRVGRVVRWPIGAWCCVGAMTSLFQVARFTGSMFVLHQDDRYLEVWPWIGIVLAVICSVASLAIAGEHRWSHPAIAVSLAVGICLSVSGVLGQSSGLRTTNSQMTSEVGLDYPLSVAEGMLVSATPAAILALRIGRMRLSPRRVVLTGVLGVWLPLLASVTLVSLAKMCGARLYWKPSLPIDFTYAFVWVFQITGMAAALLWPLAITAIGPCAVCAVWIQDFTRDWAWRWPKLLALAALAVIAFAMASQFAWDRYWLWSIAVACLLLGLARLILSLPATISAKLR